MTTPSDPQNPGNQGPGQEGSSGHPGQSPDPNVSGGYPPPSSYPPPSYPPSTPPPSGYGQEGGYPPPPPPGGTQPPGSYGSQPGGYGTPGAYGSQPGGAQPGGYGQPGDYGQQGGYGQPGGYGAPGDPYAAPGQPAYGAQPGNPYGAAPNAGGAYGAVAAPQFSVGEALSYAWERYKANPVPWIVVVLIGAVIAGVISYLGERVGGDHLVITWAFSLIGTIVSYFFQGALTRGALDEVGGTKPAIGNFFNFQNVGAVIIAALLVGIGTGIGIALCVIPGLVFAFLAYWTLAFVVDRNLSPIEAIKASFSVISKNAGQLFPLALVNALLLIVGAILCGIGLLVTAPIVMISSIYAYRVFTGGQPTPLSSAAQPPYPPTQQY